jgi:hypothetical protein
MPARRTGTEDERRALIPWVCQAVERVLPLFESERPDDDRPRRAVEAAQAFARGEIGVGAARAAAFAAHAAAREATGRAAVAAARAAGQAAAVAHMAGHVRPAADYAVRAVVAADLDAPAAAADRERAWQRRAAPPQVRRLLDI